MKLEKEFHPSRAGVPPGNSNAAFCLKMTSIAKAALTEFAATYNSPEALDICAQIEAWQSKMTLNAQKPVAQGAAGSETSTKSWPDVVSQVQALTSVIECSDAGLRPSLALRSASELVEYAGYAIAQTADSRQVIPTFLLAQTLMDRARSAEPET